MIKYGIFGGLFDPPHTAHLLIAQWVKEEFKLKKVIFIPSRNPPHKKRYSSYLARYHMTRLATKDNRDFVLSDVERQIIGRTYTIEVVKKMKRQLKGDIFLIIGADQWNEIESWKKPRELFKICKFIVIPRPGFAVRKFNGSKFKAISVSNSPLIDISSTIIRNRVKKGYDIRYLVPGLVLQYIKKNRLYS